MNKYNTKTGKSEPKLDTITVFVPKVTDSRLAPPHLVLLSLVRKGKKERLSSDFLIPLLNTRKHGSYARVAADLECWGYLTVDHQYVASSLNSQKIGVSKGYQLTPKTRKLPLVPVDISDTGQVKRYRKYLEAVEARTEESLETLVARGLRDALRGVTILGKPVSDRFSVDRNGRFYSPVTHHPKGKRDEIQIMGEPVVLVDTRASNWLSAICLYAEGTSNGAVGGPSAPNDNDGVPPSNVVTFGTGDTRTLSDMYRRDHRPVSKDALNTWFCDSALKYPESRQVEAWFKQNTPDFHKWFAKQRRIFKAATNKLWVRHERMRMTAIYEALQQRNLLQ